MPLDLTLLAAVVAVGVGFLAFWSNPRRSINRLFLALSLHAVMWLLCLRNAFAGGENGQFWVRSASAVGALIPIQLWLLRDAIVHGTLFWTKSITRNWILVVCGLALGALCFTDIYIPSHSSAAHPIYGFGYYIYMAGLAAMYIPLWRATLIQIRSQTGVVRIELQTLLVGGSAAACVVILLMALNALSGMRWLVRVQPLVILVFYSGTVVAMTMSRVFDARQLILVALQKTTLLAVVAAAAFGLDKAFGLILPEAFALFATTAVALWWASTVASWLDKIFQFYPQGTSARQAAFSAAQRESRAENLEQSFCAVLRGWGQSEHAVILSGAKDLISGGGISLPSDSRVLHALRQLRWATPERLARERHTEDRQMVADFLAKHEFGVVVMEDGPALTVAVCIGVGASRRPFTYPQVTQLMELASIMESALERAHFSAKVQHTEQLATVGLLGASLAHEIRNPLVSIKTFVQLLPTHHQDPAFREKFFRLIGDEVGRIDQLTEQLLDLASPRTYTAQVIELHPVLRASLDLVAAKAAHRSVQFLTDFQASPDRAFTDASAAKQVMLNLCFNAIQAVEQRDGEERWVRIATRNTTSGIEMAVADSGAGISSEIRPRLFQPFQTTKSTGFGLGLAICSDILANLNASITVDPPAPGTGATFRVTFPCQPLSS